MNRINLRDRVGAAIEEEWHAFALAHPQLARVLDDQMLEESATQSLADDAEFWAAMEQAQTLGATAETITDLVHRHVRRWLERLAG